MAFASVGTLGNNNDKTSDTSLALTTTADAEAGNLVVVICATDNIATADGETTLHSITDSGGNTYARVAEFTETSGAGADGVVTSIHMAKLDSTVSSGGTITLTTSSAVTAKAISAWEYTIGSTTPTVESYNIVNADGAEPSDAALSGLTSREYLWVHAMGQENTNVTITQTGWTAFDRGFSGGGGSQSNVQIGGGFQITTATGITATVSTNSDTGGHAYILAAIYEADAGSSETPTPGGAVVSGLGQTASVPAVQGGAVAGGAAPSPRSTVAQGGAVVGGFPATAAASVAAGGSGASGTGGTARVPVTPGGATAGGFAPTDGSAVTETPTPGGAVAAGVGPTAAVASTPGGALAAGVGATARAACTTGGAGATGNPPTAAVSATAGGATVSGTGPPLVRVAFVPGGALAAGFSPSELGVVILLGRAVGRDFTAADATPADTLRADADGRDLELAAAASYDHEPGA